MRGAVFGKEFFLSRHTRRVSKGPVAVIRRMLIEETETLIEG
jgi:hypothetical protein